VAAHDPDLAADLAAAYAAAGRDSDAERAYRDAIALDPDFGDAFVKLAELLLKRGAVEEARVYAEAARQLQPNGAAVGQLLARLDRTAGAGTP
jgi:Flp pilus assembly protein TadD